MDYKKLIKNFIITATIMLGLCMMIVLTIDPFFHYHKPVLGMKEILTDKEYQCIGTLRNFEYDSIIAGSSVCENYNNHWFDERFGGKTIKAVRSYGATADLCFFLNEAYSVRDVKNIYYNIDPGALSQMPYITFEETGCPMYLYDNNPFNDIEYLLNKDVLFEKIPYMISKSYLGDYDEGNSYNWGQWKEFNSDMVTGLYIREHSIKEMKDENAYEQECKANIELIENIVKEHPETNFYFFIPPYSFVWWDNVYRGGDTKAYINNMKMCAKELAKYDNARFYYFLEDEEIVCNLDNYMDVLHFSPKINEYIADELCKEERVVTLEQVDELFDKSYAFSQRVVDEWIVPYEDVIKVQPED